MALQSQRGIEIYYSRSEVYKFMKIVAKLIDEYEFDKKLMFEIPATRLFDVVQYSKNKEQAEDLLYKAKTQMPRDWKNEINVLRGKPQMEDCKHQNSLYEICKVCGLKHRVDKNV